MSKPIKYQTIFILFGVTGSGKTFFANMLAKKLKEAFPREECIILNNEYRLFSKYPADNCFYRDLRSISRRREHSFIIVNDHALSIDDLVCNLIAVDNHQKTGILLVDMGILPLGIMRNRCIGYEWDTLSTQKEIYTKTREKIPSTLPTYFVKTPPFIPDHLLDGSYSSESYMDYNKLCTQYKEQAAKEIVEMVKDKSLALTYHIFDNRNSRDTYFKDIIIDCVLKERGIHNEIYTMPPFTSYLHGLYNNGPTKKTKVDLPRKNLMDAFDAVSEKEEDDEAVWTSLLSGEPSLTGGTDTPNLFPPSNPPHTPLGVHTPETKTEDDEIAESMVKSLLMEDEDKFKDKEKEKEEEEKTISTPKLDDN